MDENDKVMVSVQMPRYLKDFITELAKENCATVSGIIRMLALECYRGKRKNGR